MNPTRTIRNNRILVVDDNPAIHSDIKKILGGRGDVNEGLRQTEALIFGGKAASLAPTEFEIDSAFQGEEGLRKVWEAAEAQRPFALAFVDVRMPPGWDGIETVTRIWKSHPDLQVVICTAYSDYAWDEMVHQLGRSDNLVILKKPFDNIEVLQLAHALTQKWALNHQVTSRLRDLDQLVAERTAELQKANEHLKGEIADRMQIEKALRLSEERFSKAFKASSIPLAIQSLLQERYVDVNQGFQDLTGFSRAELIGHSPAELGLWNSDEAGRSILKKLHEEMSVRNMPCRLHTKSQEIREILISVELFELDGQPFLLNIAQDISEQIKLEGQLRQVQKMEAMGQLAAGVAHDFNNILTVVQGYATLLLHTQPPDSKDRKALTTISAAAERAAKLVRQLLTFSRKQFMQLESVIVQSTLATIVEMLPRLVGERIRIQLTVTPDLPLIRADPAMLEQILMNLASNARDAMNGGGVLTINATEVKRTAQLPSPSPDAGPGRFIRLSVSDTGCGIPPELLPRIFEPFFTTKGVGKGTGLGLATVFGIVKQHQGWIEVESPPGQGCTFHCYFPAAPEKAEIRPTVPAPVTPDLVGGHETILVVEDEDDVRDFVAEILRGHGYKVVVATSGPQACERWSQQRDKIDLLLTDMVMPGGLSGREVAQRLLQDKPSLKVIYTSGYSPGMAGNDLAIFDGRNFLPKPHGPARLLRLVRDSLDRNIAVAAGVT